MPRTRAFVVSHTHWDRAWYLSFQRFRLHLVELVDALLEHLEREPAFVSFLLDGQTALVDDYLALRPENRERLARLAAAGRLELGPWFVLPDAFLPSGEALIRNLARGLAAARALGAEQRDGYSPDSFGHVEQMPQLLRGFGLRSFLFMRGLSRAEWQRLGCEFTWRAPDGSAVTAVYLKEGYLDASALGYPAAFGDFEGRAPDVELARERVQTSIAERRERSPSGALLLLNGCDHMPFQPELPALLEGLRTALPELELVHARLADYVDALERAEVELPEHRGDLLGNAHHPILSNVWSTRVGLKLANHRAQWWLERVVEPLACLAGPPAQTHAAALDEAWRLLLLNHPHDDLCGCSVDVVHRDGMTRFGEVEELAEGLAGEHVRALARAAGLRAGPDGGQWLCLLETDLEGQPRSMEAEIFFPLEERYPGELGDAAEPPARGLRLLDPHGREVPAQVLACEPRSFRALHLATQRGARLRVAFEAAPEPGSIGWWRALPLAQAPPAPPLPDELRCANEEYELAADAQGRVALTHRASGARVEDLLQLESLTDAGDEYSFGPLKDEAPLTTHGRAPRSVRRTAAGPAFHALTLVHRIERPRGLDDATPVALEVELELRLPATRGGPEVHVRCDNAARDHRLRLLVGGADGAEETLGGGAFTLTRRGRAPHETPESAPERWEGYPGELDYPVRFSRDVVVAPGAAHQLVVAHRGLHEHELVDTDGGRALAVTLLRAVGMLSRGGGRLRRVQAGPSVPTPEAQCLGPFEAALRIELAARELAPERAAARAFAWAQPAFCAQARLVPDGAPSAEPPGEELLVSVDEPDIALSALHPLPYSALVRLWNRADAPRAARLTLGPALLRGRRLAGAARTDLDGELLERLRVEAGALALRFGPRQILTLSLELEPA